MSTEIVLRRHANGQVVVLDAPNVAHLALEVVASADSELLRCTGGDVFTIAGQVSYRVSHWDQLQRCLVLHKADDPPAPAPDPGD